MVKVNEAKNLYKVYVDNNDPFITEVTVFDNRIREVTIDDLHDIVDIIENYCREFYDKHDCQSVSKELQMKLKNEISNILSNYTVDNALNTNWEVDVVPIVSGFKINVYGHAKNFNWGVFESSFKVGE